MSARRRSGLAAARLRRLLMAVALLAAGSCSSDGPGESGAECFDSKDNDGDGRIDCDDEDCASLDICGGTQDAGADSGRVDRGPPDLAEQDQLPHDLAPADQSPEPDLGPVSSYGDKCQFGGSLAKCPDGETYCVPTGTDSAFCTYPCSGSDDDCPATTGGRFAACVYAVNDQPYCLFVCKFLGQSYPCPDGFDCEPYTTQQSHCMP